MWADPVAAKRLVGVLPDGLTLPERLTGQELLTDLGLLRGLDRATVATIRTILRRFVDAGGSVVLSSHLMALVEQLCDPRLLPGRGRVHRRRLLAIWGAEAVARPVRGSRRRSPWPSPVRRRR